MQVTGRSPLVLVSSATRMQVTGRSPLVLVSSATRMQVTGRSPLVLVSSATRMQVTGCSAAFFSFSFVISRLLNPLYMTSKLYSYVSLYR
jgi:hypothetical protein